MAALSECSIAPLSGLCDLSQALHVCLGSCEFGCNLRKTTKSISFLAAAVRYYFLGENRLVSNFAPIPDS